MKEIKELKEYDKFYKNISLYPNIAPDDNFLIRNRIKNIKKILNLSQIGFFVYVNYNIYK